MVARHALGAAATALWGNRRPISRVRRFVVPHLAVFVDRVPAGEVEVRRHEQVHTADNAIARVEGLVVDDADHITHVLLQEGHLWGRVLITLRISSS
jgi:hypothetical protein